MRILILVVIFVMMSGFAHADEAEKFCDDPKAWEHFNSIVVANPNDTPLQILHALRIGLCVKIQENSITTDEAIQLFNDMVDNVAIKRGEEDEAEETHEF